MRNLISFIKKNKQTKEKTNFKNSMNEFFKDMQPLAKLIESFNKKNSNIVEGSVHVISKEKLWR